MTLTPHRLAWALITVGVVLVAAGAGLLNPLYAIIVAGAAMIAVGLLTEVPE